MYKVGKSKIPPPPSYHASAISVEDKD